MGPYPSQVELAQYTSPNQPEIGVGISTACRELSARVRPRVVGVVDVWMDYDPGMGPCRPWVTLTLLSSLGDPYVVYEPRAMGDQTKRPCFYFRWKLEPEILTAIILSAVTYCICKK